MTNPDTPEVYSSNHDSMIQVFIDQHRQMLHDSLETLTEPEVRMQLVNSKTTLLGLLKHATFVERVWFGEAAAGTSRKQLGIPDSPDETFDLLPTDSIESVQRDYTQAIEHSRKVVQGASGDEIFPGNRRGPLPLRWIQLHVLRELAQHCGHADIVREQIIDARQ